MNALFNDLLERGKNFQPFKANIKNGFNYDKNNEEHEITNTISLCYIPLKKLKKEYQYSENYIRNVEQLSIKFAAWKRSRGDGNCYYRSVISSFVVKLCHPKYFQNYFSNFYNQVQTVVQSSTFTYNFDMSNYFIQRLHYLYNSNNRLSEVHQYLADEKFDQGMIFTSRALSYLKLLEKLCEPDFTAFFVDDEVENMKNNLMTMGREAESQELFLLPGALNIEVTQINILDNWIENIYPEPDLTQTKMKVSVISKSKGHYDGLYSKYELEQESYNMRDRDYYLDAYN